MPLTTKRAPCFALLAVGLAGCESDMDIAYACPIEGAPATDESALPGGATVAEAAELVVGSVPIALSADLPSGAWSADGHLRTVRAGAVLTFSAPDEYHCPYEDWIEAPLTLTLSSDDGALAAEVGATGEVSSDDEVRIVAYLPFLDFGEPFASVVAEAQADAEAAGCVVGDPFDTVSLIGTLDSGYFVLSTDWSCDGGNRTVSPENTYRVAYAAL